MGVSVARFISLGLGLVLAFVALILQLFGNSLSYLIAFISVFCILVGLFLSVIGRIALDSANEEDDISGGKLRKEENEKNNLDLDGIATNVERSGKFDRNQFREKTAMEFFQKFQP